MNKIRSENANPGSSDWLLRQPAATVHDRGLPAEIEGFCVPYSVSPGDTLNVMVATQAAQFRAEVYRLGYYGGAGGRLMKRIDPLTKVQQPGPQVNTRGDTSCQWQVSFTVPIPDDWVSGCYLIKLITVVANDADRKERWASFVVRSLFDEPIDFVVLRDIATDAAYNNRFGNQDLTQPPYDDLYGTDHGTVKRSNAVTLDRPEAWAWGAGRLLLHEYPMIRWLESEGFSLAYICSTDLHQNGSVLLKSRAFLCIGHAEYWSFEMRNNVEIALEHGVSVGFFGANICYWQVRFESTPLGLDRRVICYKEPWGMSTDAEVPNGSEYKTTTWRHKDLGRPEQNLCGVMYFNFLADSSNLESFIPKNTGSWPYKGTGASEDKSLPGIIGYEVDRIFSNGEAWTEGPGGYIYPIQGIESPDEQLILGRSPVKDGGAIPNNSINSTTADTVLTIRSSSTRVFGAGTIGWGLGLADAEGTQEDTLGVLAGPPWNILNPVYEHKELIGLTRNILHNFTAGPLAILAVEPSGVREVYKEQWLKTSPVLPWRPSKGRALAGRFLNASAHSYIALLSNPGAAERRLAFLEYQRGGSISTAYQERFDRSADLDGWHDENDIVLAGNFLGSGRDQLLFINNGATAQNQQGCLMIVDYSTGTFVRKYLEAWDQHTYLNGGLHDDKDIFLAGDFLGRGHDQLLFINNGATAQNQQVCLMIVDYSPVGVQYQEAWGQHTYLNGWHDDGDISLAGDFLGRGHDQLLVINKDGTPPNTGRLMIVDYSTGTPVKAYYEAWGDKTYLDGWHDDGDISLAGDFLGRGHDQLLFINNDGTPPNIGRLMIVDYSTGTPVQAYYEAWGNNPLLNGWSLADIALVGSFSPGTEQMVFLPT